MCGFWCRPVVAPCVVGLGEQVVFASGVVVWGREASRVEGCGGFSRWVGVVFPDGCGGCGVGLGWW